jgi:hypothetical protein
MTESSNDDGRRALIEQADALYDAVGASVFREEFRERYISHFQDQGSVADAKVNEPTKAQRKAARKAVEREMRSRTYDRHAYDEDVFKEGVRDIADAAVRAAIAVEREEV